MLIDWTLSDFEARGRAGQRGVEREYEQWAEAVDGRDVGRGRRLPVAPLAVDLGDPYSCGPPIVEALSSSLARAIATWHTRAAGGDDVEPAPPGWGNDELLAEMQAAAAG